MPPPMTTYYNWHFDPSKTRKWDKTTLRQALQHHVPQLKRRRTKRRMIEALDRIEHGKMAYDVDASIDREQLIKFIEDRKLTLPKPPTDPAMIAILKQADDNPSFHRFLDLARELRDQIYEFYFAMFKNNLHIPAQPPLARTCRRLRRESLPLFYKTCSFQLNYTNSWRPALTTRTRMYLEDMPKLAQGYIRNGVLQRVGEGRGPNAIHFVLGRECSIMVDWGLEDSNDSEDSDYSDDSEDSGSWERLWNALYAKFEMQLKEFFQSVADREWRRKGLLLGDLHRAMRVMDDWGKYVPANQRDECIELTGQRLAP